MSGETAKSRHSPSSIIRAEARAGSVKSEYPLTMTSFTVWLAYCTPHTDTSGLRVQIRRPNTTGSSEPPSGTVLSSVSAESSLVSPTLCPNEGPSPSVPNALFKIISTPPNVSIPASIPAFSCWARTNLLEPLSHDSARTLDRFGRFIICFIVARATEYFGTFSGK
jgi:hypothetical protein